MSFIKLARTFISIKGEDAEKFLQGQVSCDVSTLNDEQFSFGTLNTPKGRIYGLFKIIRFKDGFILSVEPSTSPLIIKQLSKYCVFFKCVINEESSYSAYGNVIESSEEAPCSDQYPSEGFNIAITPQRITLRLPSFEEYALFENWYLEGQEPNMIENKVSYETWSTFETRQGIPELYEKTQDAFILQYLNLQELGAVSFKKGCYTGQEIIARMKFLGKQKKMTYLLTSKDKLTVNPSTNIYKKDGSKCGTVVRSHWSDQTGSVTLAIINNSYVEENSTAYLDPECTAEFEISTLNYS